MNTFDIDYSEICRYLGTDIDTVDSLFLKEIQDAVVDILKIIEVRSTWKAFDFKKQDTICLVNTNITLDSNDIKDILKQSHQCIFLVTSLGHQIDALIRNLQIKNMAKALIYDACASSIIESATNNIEKEIRTINYPTLYFTDRFSPGYGDLPITFQKDICTVLETNKNIGVSVTSSGIMLPKKTISAIIGIANTPQRKKIRGCSFCDLQQNCSYRLRGKQCD